MNYGYVRLEGTVTRGPLYDADAQALRFSVADDTGEIQAVTFGEVTKELVAQKKIPSVGDKVSVEGNLRVRDDFASLNVATANTLRLTVPNWDETNMAEIGPGDEFRYIEVHGDVREIRQPFQGLTLITVGDSSGELDVAISGDVEKLYGSLPPFTLGDTLRIRGIVTFFRDAPQLVLRHPKDVEKLEVENTAAKVQSIAELNASQVNQRVRVMGKVTSVSRFSQGVRVALTDDTGEITLVLWQDILDRIGHEDELQKGAQVSAVGKLTRYRGDFEIQPSSPEDVSITVAIVQNLETPEPNATMAVDAMEPTPAGAAPGVTSRPLSTRYPTREPTAAPVEREISSLTEQDKGVKVIVQGRITRGSEFSQGMRYELNDGSGELTLVIWSDVWVTIANRDTLVEGAEIRVEGKIDIFNNALEIIPAQARDIELVRAVVAPTVVTRTIGSISTTDLDHVVSLQGTISAVMDFSAGKYVTLEDGSGKIRVTLFTRVLAPVESRLAIGAQTSVRGKVNVFRGNMEVVASEIGFP